MMGDAVRGDVSEADALLLAAEVGGNAYEVDLHGMDRAAAIETVDAAIDAAFMTGDRVLRVIHGSGSGALRTAVREFVGRHALVETWRALPGAQTTGAIHVVVAKSHK